MISVFANYKSRSHVNVQCLLAYFGLINCIIIIGIISIFFNHFKLEVVVLLQSEYETWNSNQNNHFQEYHPHTCLSRSPHVCDL